MKKTQTKRQRTRLVTEVLDRADMNRPMKIKTAR
jgi:hypothetical protein